jgi:hypothetical protein
MRTRRDCWRTNDNNSFSDDFIRHGFDFGELRSPPQKSENDGCDSKAEDDIGTVGDVVDIHRLWSLPKTTIYLCFVNLPLNSSQYYYTKSLSLACPLSQ